MVENREGDGPHHNPLPRPPSSASSDRVRNVEDRVRDTEHEADWMRDRIAAMERNTEKLGELVAALTKAGERTADMHERTVEAINALRGELHELSLATKPIVAEYEVAPKVRANIKWYAWVGFTVLALLNAPQTYIAVFGNKATVEGVKEVIKPAQPAGVGP